MILDLENQIAFHDSFIDCNSCENEWMIRDERDEQVIGANCSHDHDLTLFSPKVRSDLIAKCKLETKLNKTD